MSTDSVSSILIPQFNCEDSFSENVIVDVISYLIDSMQAINEFSCSLTHCCETAACSFHRHAALWRGWEEVCVCVCVHA